MITSFLLLLVYATIWVLTLILRVLPNVTMPTWVTDTVSTASMYLSTGRQLLPTFLATLLLTWGIYLGIELAIFSYKGIKWVYKKIPGVN